MNYRYLGGFLSLLALSTAVVVWWMIGDLSEPDLFAPDYMFEPPRIAGTVEDAIGIVGSIVTTAILIVLLRALASRITRRQFAATVPVIALGAYVGFSWRVMTAAVSGANIGGGLLMLVAIVFVPAMAFLAQLLWRVRPDGSLALST